MEFPVFQRADIGTPAIAYLHDIRTLSLDDQLLCQASLLQAGVEKWGEEEFVLKGDGFLYMSGPIRALDDETPLGAVALYDVEVVSQIGDTVNVSGSLLVASSEAIIAAIVAGVVGFQAVAEDPEEEIQTVNISTVWELPELP